MTLFQEIKKEYNLRYAKYKNRNYSKIVSKAYNKFKYGKEIKWDEVKSFSSSSGIQNLLSEILIELPTIKMAYDEIEIKLSEIDNNSDMEIQMIYGEYGQGKSQLGHLLIENFSRSYAFPNLICLYYSVSTFSDFINTLISCFSLYFNQKPEYNKIEPYLDNLKNFKTKKKFSLMEIIKNIIDLIKEISNRGYKFLLIFDELSKTLSHPDDFKFWGDLFIELNDADNLKLLLVFLIPNSTGEEIRKRDKRFERWNVPFDINAINLSGKFLDKTPCAISNILSMKSIKSKNSFDDLAFRFFTNVIFHQKNYLENESIRLVNTFAVQLAEFYDKMLKWKLNTEIMVFKPKSAQSKGQIIESKLRIFLEKAQLPDFKKKDKETRDYETFRALYSKKNLEVDHKKSDGHFRLEKIIKNIISEESKIAVEIKFATNGDHTKEQLKKVEILAKEYPTLLISIGSEYVLFKNHSDDMKQWNKDNPSSYPIKLVHIPDILYYPLLILGLQKKDNLMNKIQVLSSWAKIFCKFFEEIQIFMKNIPTLLIERDYKMKFESLKVKKKKSKTKPKKISGLDSFTPDISDITENNFEEAIICLCSFIGTKIKKFKGYDVLQRGLMKEIKTQYPQVKEKFERNFSKYIKELRKNNQIEIYEASDGKRKIRKTLDWDSEESMNILLNKFQ